MPQKTNNNRIITEVYNEYRTPFLIFAQKNYGLSEAISEDIYQETMLAFHQNVQNGKLHNLNVPLKTYVFAIGKNKIVDHFRKIEKEVNTLPFPGVFPSDEDMFNCFYDEESDSNKRNMIVHTAVRQMESPCKEILFLFYWREKSMKEIAKQMNYNSPDVAKQQKSRCIRKITAYLTGKLNEAELI
jgi:RNA polymerase sigma factor (sigma-70 family)